MTWRQALAFWLTSVSVLAHAQPLPDWQAPTGCPDAAAIGDAATTHPRAIAALTTGSALVRISHAATGELLARLTSGRGPRPQVRELHGSDCKSLTEAALLVLDLASTETDPTPAQHTPETQTPPSSLPPPAASPPAKRTEPTRVATAATHSAVQPRPPVRLGVLGLMQLDLGSLPEPAVGFAAGLALQRSHYWTELRGTYFPERPIRVQGAVGVGAELGLAHASA